MRQSQQAFTLIELMVVMAIMTVIFSLIGPLTQNQIDRIRAQNEWYQFIRLNKKISSDAYFKGTTHFINLNGNELLIRHGNTNSVKIKYNHLSFETQNYEYTAHGYPTTLALKVKVRNVERNLELLEMDPTMKVLK